MLSIINVHVCLSAVQAVELYVLITNFVYFVESCPRFFWINGHPHYRYHCNVTSFPAKDDKANLSLEDLSTLLRSSASEMIQSRNRPRLLFASNFTFQGALLVK